MKKFIEVYDKSSFWHHQRYIFRQTAVTFSSHFTWCNWHLQFFFRSKNLFKIIKNTDHRSSQSAANSVTNSFEQIERGAECMFRFIDSLLIIMRLSFSSKSYFLFSRHRKVLDLFETKHRTESVWNASLVIFKKVDLS